jgi:Tol biopolymer transport system component
MKQRILIIGAMTFVFVIVHLAAGARGAALGSAEDLWAFEPSPAASMSSGGGTGRIAFVSDRDENWEVYTVNADGSEPTNLSDFPQSGGYAWPSTDVKPSWSPDGQRIAFASDRHADFKTDPDGNRDIYLMDAGGSNLVRLTEHPAHDDFPAWSPDGQRIAFASQRDGNWEIYVVKADGSGRTRLTHEPLSDAMPAWSPDGEHIVFCSDRDGNTEIYVMKADGSGQTRLTDHWKLDFGPAWSPDGQHIAFVSDRDWDAEIYVMRADGSGVTNVTNHEGIDVEPAWSPDGTRIAFMSRRDDNAEIYVMKADGSDQINVTHHPQNDFLPSWQPSLPTTALAKAQEEIQAYRGWLQQSLKR